VRPCNACHEGAALVVRSTGGPYYTDVCFGQRCALDETDVVYADPCESLRPYFRYRPSHVTDVAHHSHKTVFHKPCGQHWKTATRTTYRALLGLTYTYPESYWVYTVLHTVETKAWCHTGHCNITYKPCPSTSTVLHTQYFVGWIWFSVRCINPLSVIHCFHGWST